MPPIALGQSSLPSETRATIEMLESRLQEVKASTDLDESNQTQLLDLYRKAISLVEQQRTHEAATQKFIKARDSAPKQSALLREQLEDLEAEAPLKLLDSLSSEALPQLEQQLLSEKADLTGLANSVAGLEVLQETQAQRPQQARERLNEARRLQAKITDTLQLPPSEGQLPRLVEAKRWSLEQEARTLGAELEMLDQELLSQPLRIELLGAQRDKATQELNRQQDYVELLESKVAERRLSEAETVKEETEETERQAFGKHALLQEIAQQNTQLSDELNQLVVELEKITIEENIAATQARRIADSFRLARQKLEIAGLSQALGQVLLGQRRILPDSGEFKASEKRRQDLVIASSLRQLRNQQERARLRDIKVYVDDLTESLSETWKSLLRDDVLALAELRRDLLDKAIAADDTYQQTLGELDFSQRQLAETVTDYSKFLDERLLWIRTGEPPSWETLKSISQNIAVFTSPQHWLELGRALVFLLRSPGFC